MLEVEYVVLVALLVYSGPTVYYMIVLGVEYVSTRCSLYSVTLLLSIVHGVEYVVLVALCTPVTLLLSIVGDGVCRTLSIVGGGGCIHRSVPLYYSVLLRLLVAMICYV